MSIGAHKMKLKLTMRCHLRGNYVYPNELLKKSEHYCTTKEFERFSSVLSLCTSKGAVSLLVPVNFISCCFHVQKSG